MEDRHPGGLPSPMPPGGLLIQNKKGERFNFRDIIGRHDDGEEKDLR